MIPAPTIRIVALPAAGHGSTTDLSVHALRLTYEDRDDALDKVTVQLANPGLALLDQRDVLGGARWQVSWGVDGAMARPRLVTVRSVRGVEVLTVEGYARHFSMDAVARSRVFRGLTRSEVMRQVAAVYGYQGVLAQIADTEERFESVHQVAETDGQFLRRLARLEDFTFSLDDDRLVIGPASSLTEPVRVFEWRPGRAGGDVLSINVETNLAMLAGQVVLRGRDPREKKTVTATATRTSDEQHGLRRWFDLIDPESGRTRTDERGATSVTRPTTVTSVAGVERKASATLRRLDADAVRLSLEVLGDVTLRPRQVVELRGASQRLSGRYYVRSAKHTVSAEGYRSELTMRRLVGGEGAVIDGAGAARPPATTQGAQPTARPLAPIDLVDPESGRTTTQLR